MEEPLQFPLSFVLLLDERLPPCTAKQFGLALSSGYGQYSLDQGGANDVDRSISESNGIGMGRGTGNENGCRYGYEYGREKEREGWGEMSASPDDPSNDTTNVYYPSKMTSEEQTQAHAPTPVSTRQASREHSDILETLARWLPKPPTNIGMETCANQANPRIRERVIQVYKTHRDLVLFELIHVFLYFEQGTSKPYCSRCMAGWNELMLFKSSTTPIPPRLEFALVVLDGWGNVVDRPVVFEIPQVALNVHASTSLKQFGIFRVASASTESTRWISTEYYMIPDPRTIFGIKVLVRDGIFLPPMDPLLTIQGAADVLTPEISEENLKQTRSKGSKRERGARSNSAKNDSSVVDCASRDMNRAHVAKPPALPLPQQPQHPQNQAQPLPLANAVDPIISPDDTRSAILEGFVDSDYQNMSNLIVALQATAEKIKRKRMMHEVAEVLTGAITSNQETLELIQAGVDATANANASTNNIQRISSSKKRKVTKLGNGSRRGVGKENAGAKLMNLAVDLDPDQTQLTEAAFTKHAGGDAAGSARRSLPALTVAAQNENSIGTSGSNAKCGALASNQQSASLALALARNEVREQDSDDVHVKVHVDVNVDVDGNDDNNDCSESSTSLRSSINQDNEDNSHDNDQGTNSKPRSSNMRSERRTKHLSSAARSIILSDSLKEQFHALRHQIHSYDRKKMLHILQYADLVPFFSLPRDLVANKLGICVTLFKKICRKNSIEEWPYRKFRKTSHK